MATIVFVADGWGSQYGGINSFNYDLCLNMHSVLNLEEHGVVCVTTGATLSEQDYESAKEKGLLLVHFAKNDFDCDKIVKRLNNEHMLQETIWWIGHDIMTGFLASECAEISDGKCAIIHHMNYEAYYPYVSECPDDTDKKVEQQLQVFNKADIIFSVGPKLTKSANDIVIKLNKDIKIIELIPGIAPIIPLEKILGQFSTMVFGRVSTDQRDVVKQSMLAIAGFAYANRNREFSNNDPNITVYGLNSNEIKQVNSELRSMASNFAGRIVKVKGYEYTNNREKLWSSLRCQSVCMMLSLHEGFGLAGWEAISAGVPLIVSENSGLYELLCQKRLNLKVCSLNISGDSDKKDDSNDIKRVAKFLREIRKDLEAYKKNAIELRKTLLNEGCTWENTALTLTKAVGIETKEEARIRKMMNIIRKRIDSIPEIAAFSKWQWETIMDEFLVCKKYPECNSCLKDLAKDVKKGKNISVLGIHCSTFCPDANNYVADCLYNDESISVRILSASPTSDYLLERLLTIPKYRDNNDELRFHYEQLCKTAKIFCDRRGYNTRFFDSVPYFRLYLTFDHLYFSCYRDGIHAKYEEIFLFDNTTQTYNLFSKYFDYAWSNSSDELHIDERDLPPDKKHLLLDRWSVKPSLVVNVCSKCNMNCCYCPEGGENLNNISDEEYCNEQKLVSLVKIFSNYNTNKVIRITGGEPLISEKIRRRTAKIMRASSDYKKIILCTNGTFIKEAYNENKNLWERLKSKILLKISLDTLDSQYFQCVTGCKQELHSKIIEGIRFIREKGFEIELNIVVREANVHEIPALFEFAKTENLVGIKILTVNDFGNRVDVSISERNYVTKQLNEIMQQMRECGLREHDASLHDGAGIVMKRYHAKSHNDSDCTLTIVDHNVKGESITPRRTFCEDCLNCKFYPCATGLLNLTLRADGMLSYCRLKVESAVSIKELSDLKMNRTIKEMLKPFSKCFEG